MFLKVGGILYSLQVRPYSLLWERNEVAEL